MVCIGIFSKYCAIVPIIGKTEKRPRLTLHSVHAYNGRTTASYNDRWRGNIKNSGYFRKYIGEHHITYIPSRGHPVFAERMIRTFRDLLDKRINPDEQWADLIFPILLTYNNKLVHCAT